MSRFAPNPRIQSLDWSQIREEWETTDASFTSIAAQYGTTRHTVSRRAIEMNWVKRTGDMPTPRDAQAIGAVAQTEGGAPVIASPDAVQRGIDAAIEAVAVGLGDSGGDAPPYFTAGSAAPDDEVEHIRIGETSRFDVAEDRSVSSAVTAMHAASIHRQIAMAGEIQQVGMEVVRRIRDLIPDVKTLALDPESPETAHALSLALQTAQMLCRVNPDRETLAGLLKTAADVVDRGVLMERRAMGMAPPKAAPPAQAGTLPPQITSPGAAAAIASLDPDAAQKLRQFIIEYQRAARRQQIEEMA